jgi:hypothetical protein
MEILVTLLPMLLKFLEVFIDKGGDNRTLLRKAARYQQLAESDGATVGEQFAFAELAEFVLCFANGDSAHRSRMLAEANGSVADARETLANQAMIAAAKGA